MTNRFSQSVVGVVLGGMSREREVSLNTGRAVIGALKRKGYRVVEIDANRELDRQLRTIKSRHFNAHMKPLKRTVHGMPIDGYPLHG